MEKTRRIKVLMLINSLVGGGAEKQFIQVANRLSRDVFDVSVCVAAARGECSTELNKETLCRYLEITKRSKFDFFRIFLVVRKMINDVQPDIVHSWLTYSNLINSLIPAKNHARIIGIRNDLDDFDYGGTLKNALGRFSLALSFRGHDVILINSSKVATSLAAAGAAADHIFTIKNGIDISATLARSRGEPAFSDFPEGKVNLLSVGRLEVQKGHSYLLEAAKRVLDSGREINLLIVGSGRLRDSLIKQINTLGIGEHARILEFQDNVLPFMRRSDIVILPSIYESFPNAVMEAMTLAKPVIATNVGGVPELIDHDVHGWLVPPQDSRAIADGIIHMLDDRHSWDRLGDAALQRIRDNYQFEKIIPDFETLYMIRTEHFV